MDIGKNNLIYKLNQSNNYLINKYKDSNTKISPKNTLFILDWDDTLFPTSWIAKNNIDILHTKKEEHIEHFYELDKTLSNFLKTLSKHGRIIIITNALSEWVRISSHVMPITYGILKKITVISAKEFIGRERKNVMDWKKITFFRVIDHEFKNINVMNIISIGDDEYERYALKELSNTNMDKIKYLKSFRLLKEPNYNEIIEQINILNMYMPHMWNKCKQICKTFVQQ